MASADPGERPEVQPINIPCRHLRSKGMYVYTDGLGGEAPEDYDNTIYWCLKTMKGFGPDDGLVSGEDCRDAARSCYEPF